VWAASLSYLLDESVCSRPVSMREFSCIFPRLDCRFPGCPSVRDLLELPERD